MKRMRRYGWNLESMNEYCIDEDNGYTILDIKYVKKTIMGFSKMHQPTT